MRSSVRAEESVCALEGSTVARRRNASMNAFLRGIRGLNYSSVSGNPSRASSFELTKLTFSAMCVPDESSIATVRARGR